VLNRPLKLFYLFTISDGLSFELETTLHTQNPRSDRSYLFLLLRQRNSHSFLIEIRQQLVTLRIVYQRYRELRTTEWCPSITHPLNRFIMIRCLRSISYGIDPRLQLFKSDRFYFPSKCHRGSFRFFNHLFIIIDYEGRTISSRRSRVNPYTYRKIYIEISNHRDNPEPVVFK